MHIIGRKPVLEALRAGKNISKIYLLFGAHGDPLPQIRREARERKVPVIELPKKKFDRYAELGTTQGIVALVEDVRTWELEDLLAAVPPGEKPFFVALDAIQDPHNAGAIIRTAECAGAHGVILPRHDSAPLTETVVKAAAGATAHIRIARVGNLAQALAALKERDIWIAGMDDEGKSDLFRFDGDIPLCLVIGNEAQGMRPIIKKLCDTILRIPMRGKVSSLNASVAAGLAMYEVVRRRIKN